MRLRSGNDQADLPEIGASGRVLERIASGPLYALLFVGVLAVAAWLRWRLDAVPVYGLDSMGYFGPALSHHAGGPFELLFGRPFLYPAFLWVVLELTGSVGGIFYAQTAAGLVSLVVLERAWRRAGRMFAFGRGGTAAYAGVGLLVVAGIGWSGSMLQLEIELRPESIFPLFVSASLYCAARTVEEWRRGPAGPGPLLWPAGLLLLNCTMQVLKPNWGFGAATASLPVLLWVCASGRSPWMRIAPVAVALALFLSAVYIPHRQLSSRDTSATVFLWHTLFLWHAPAVANEIGAELRSSEDLPNRAFLESLHELLQDEFAFSRSHPDGVGYGSLGYDPDRLLYASPFKRLMDDAFDADRERQAAFMRDYYVRAWRHHTSFMIGKILGQLWFYYGDSEVIYRAYTGRSLPGQRQTAVRALEGSASGRLVSPVLRSAVESNAFRELRHRSTAVARDSKLGYATPAAATWLVGGLRWSYTPILLFCTVLATLSWLPGDRWKGLHRLRFPLLLAVTFYAYNFGHTLTFAAIHALDQERYSMTQLTATLFSHIFGIVVVVYAAAGYGRTNASRSPPA